MNAELTPETEAAMTPEPTKPEPTKPEPTKTNTAAHDRECGQAALALNVADALLALTRSAAPALDEEVVRRIVAEMLAAQTPRRVRIEFEDREARELEGPLPENFFRILKRLKMRMNTLLVGPAGCGKTHVVRLAAEALGLDFASISLSAGISEGALLGRLLPTGDGGRFEYSRSEFVRLFEEGGVFLLDELDAADANTLLVLNTALANGHLPLPSRPERPQAERHADFVCVGTANTFGNGASREYAAREQIDAATLDRFRASVITCDYDTNVEESLVDPNLLAWGRGMRARLQATNLRRFVSTRFLIDGSRILGAASWDDLMDSYFADWKADERSRVGELAPAQPFDVIADGLVRQQNRKAGHK